MRRIFVFSMLASGFAFAAPADKPVAQRERDTADRNAILRWYDWGKQGKDGQFVRCEGKLDYDIEIPKSGWYVLEQQGMPPEWSRTIYLDGRAVRSRLETGKNEFSGPDKGKAWFKDLNLFIEKGRRTISYERTGFPGCFPVRWRLVPSDGTVRGTLRVDIVQDVVRSTD